MECLSLSMTLAGFIVGQSVEVGEVVGEWRKGKRRKGENNSTRQFRLLLFVARCASVLSNPLLHTLQHLHLVVTLVIQFPRSGS